MTMNEKRRMRTVKFSISVPGPDFKAIEAARKEAGKTRSRFLRDAALGDRVRWGAGEAGTRFVREERGAYGPSNPAIMEDPAELRRRAVAAAGVFASGLPDLSIGHDRYLSENGSDPERRRPERESEGEKKP
jgi:hypothetical protein